MQQRPQNLSSLSVHCLWWNPEFYYRIYKIQLLIPLQSQMNPDHNITAFALIFVLILSLWLNVGCSSDTIFFHIFQLNISVHFSYFSSVQPACSSVRSHLVYYLPKKVWLRIVLIDTCVYASINKYIPTHWIFYCSN